MSTKSLGEFGEGLAADYLRENGYRILERNWRTDHKEIDIIARKKGARFAGASARRAIIFVEVKTLVKENRNRNRFLPEESIGPQKKKDLLLACKYYLFSKKFPGDTPWQIDVISVEIDTETEKPKIHHFENEIF